jgi:exo-1,4-beta-D-glucosaminidase
MAKKTLLKTIVYIAVITFFAACNNVADTNITSTVKIDGDWIIFNSDSCVESGEIISAMDFSPKRSYKTDVPSTVFHTLVENKIYDSVYWGTNLSKIDTVQFAHSWWYRTQFSIIKGGNFTELQFDGINYKANIWLNGKLIADTNEINNAFKMFRFDVSNIVKKGTNVLAVEVFPPKAGDFSIGFVDWNPAPPDQNMGIFRSVYLNSINKVQISKPYIESYFKNKDFTKAYQNASVRIKNFSDEAISGVISVEINNKTITQEVKLAARESKKILFRAADYPELIVENPELWWPHTLGEPIMHTARFVFNNDGVVLAENKIKYGIREITDYFNAEGHRGFIVNGHKISIRGGGWVDNIMLDNTHEYDRAQLEYVKQMNLNTIRLEGFWGKDDYIYNTCDELGILVMVGWSCHWEWENYLGKYCDEKYGGILNDYDVNLISTAWTDQLVWLRNHPSIIGWFGGSDCIATPKLENSYFETFNEYDSTRVYLSSAKEWESDDIKSGVKMRGPYAYEPPIYWFADTLYGGAFGFNTETGPGAQVPPIESIRKMIPQKDLWPMNEVWDYHCGRNEFNDLSRFTKALNARYGAAQSVEEYAEKAQLLNYELMRPMFEAFSANRYKATGVVQWMLNSAWPEMYWQLYDSYLMPNGAFYATKKSGEPLHALYNYANHSIYLVNDQLNEETDVEVLIQVFDVNSKLIYSKELKQNIEANTSIKINSLPEFKNISKTYFVDLRIKRNNVEIANNFYWLSTKADVLDYDFEFESWYYHTPSKEYADFTALNTMKKAKVSSKLHTIQANGSSDSSKLIFTAELENTSSNIAFFIEMQLVDKKTGELILPVLWDDNYISLLANEKRSISMKVDQSLLENKEVGLRVKGYNLK